MVINMKIAFLTLGCKVNYYETEKMIGSLKEKGHDIVEFEDEADVYVINTCTVTNIADRKSRQMIHRAKKNYPDAIVVAIGCYVESAGESGGVDPSVDIAYTNKDKYDFAERLEQDVLSLMRSSVSTHDDAVAAEAGAIRISDGDDGVTGQLHRKGRTRAFIKIQDGCNQFCSYCLIPFVRGRGKLTFTPPDEVEREVLTAVGQGCHEIVLTGIHLSSYGVTEERADAFVREGGKALSGLIKRLDAIDGVQRIRLGSLEPRIITEDWLAELSDCESLCPHFHLSLQSGSDATLGRMNRHYTCDEYADRVGLLRRYYDAPAITTDVIVGFPGETDEEFAETEAFLERIGFAELHIFQYSMRSGTRAAAMDGQVPPEIKKLRSERLIEKAAGWRRSYIESQTKPVQDILFEEYADLNGRRLLTGFNERYVRYGVSDEYAEKNGCLAGNICTVPQECLEYMQ